MGGSWHCFTHIRLEITFQNDHVQFQTLALTAVVPCPGRDPLRALLDDMSQQRRGSFYILLFGISETTIHVAKRV